MQHLKLACPSCGHPVTKAFPLPLGLCLQVNNKTVDSLTINATQACVVTFNPVGVRFCTPHSLFAQPTIRF